MTRKKLEVTLLGILIAAHLLCNFIWINSNSNVLIFQGKSWQKNINIYSVLKHNLAEFQKPNKEINFSKLYNLVVIDEYSPPFYFWIAALVNLLLSSVIPQAMLLSSSLFFIFLIIIVYKTGEYLSKGSGMLSAFICSLYPFIYLPSRAFNMALAVGVMVTLSVFILLKTEMFSSRAYSIALGVCLALGMLTKYTFFVFLIGPVTAVVFEIIKKRKNDSVWRQRRNNILISFAIAAIISGAYYFNHRVLSLLFSRGLNLDQSVSDMTIAQRIIFYLKILFVQEIGIIPAVYTMGLSILYFRTKFAFKRIMGLWIFLSFILIAITPKQDPQAEYIIPLLPAFGLISGIVINSIKRNLVKYAIALSLCAVMLLQFFQPYNPEKAFCFSKETSEIKDIFSSMGRGKSKIGYICPSSERYRFLGIETFLSLWSDDKAEIDDLSLYSQGISIDLDKFDLLVSVYSNDRDYLGKDYLSEFEELDSFYFSPVHVVRGPYLKISVFQNKRAKRFNDVQSISNPIILNRLCLKRINRIACLSALDAIKMLKYAGEYLEALEIIDKAYGRDYSVGFAIQKNELIFSELIDIARISRRNDNHQAALLTLKKAFEFNFDRTLVFAELDELFIAWRNPEKAISFYKELELKLPRSKDLFLRLSRQYKILQDYENVKKYFHKVLELDPNCLEAKIGIVDL